MVDTAPEASPSAGKRGVLHPLSIFRHSSKFSTISLVGYALSVPASIFVAGILGPQDYGVVALVGLWVFYANLIKPGMLGAASREMPHLLGEGKVSESIRIQNVAISWEVLYSVLPVLVIAGSSFLFDDLVIKIGLLISAATVGLTVIEGTYGGLQWVHQQFSVLTKVKLIQVVVTPLLMISLVLVGGIYGVLLVPLIASALITLYYVRFTPKLGFKLDFDKSTALRLLKIGLVLQLLALVFWTFRTVDRTLVAAWFSLSQLGYYGLALNFQLKLADLIADFGRVLQTILWRQMGESNDVLALRHDLILLSLVIGVGSGFMVSFSQATFGALIYVFLPKFVPSIHIFEILCFDLFFIGSTMVPGLVLQSSLIGRQKSATVVWIGGLAAVLLTSFLFARYFELGPAGVAWGFLAAQILVAVSLYKLSLKYILRDYLSRLRFYVTAFGFIAAMGGVWLLLLGPLAFSPDSVLVSLVLRILLVSGVWAAVGAVAWTWLRRRRSNPIPSG